MITNCVEKYTEGTQEIIFDLVSTHFQLTTKNHLTATTTIVIVPVAVGLPNQANRFIPLYVGRTSVPWFGCRT